MIKIFLQSLLYVITNMTSDVVRSEKISLYELVAQTGIFFAGNLIDDLYLDQKETYLNFFSDDGLNRTLQSYIFSLAFQIFLDSYAFNSYSVIFEDIINISVIYVILALKKNFDGKKN